MEGATHYPYYLRRPQRELHRSHPSGEYAADRRIQRLARSLYHRQQNRQQLRDGTDYDDAGRIPQMDGETQLCRLLPLEEPGDTEGERKGQVRLHGHALLPRTGRKDLRAGRRTHQDTGIGRTEVRRQHQEHRQPVAAHPQPQDDSDGLRRENQCQCERKSG